MAPGIRFDRLEYGEVLSDANIAQFLATQHWSIQKDRQFDQVWVQPGAQGQMLASLLLPRDGQLVDYSRRLQEALETIGEVYDWDLGQIAEQVAAVRADLFFVRVDQNMMDGTIPLRQATSLLENIDQMIRSAAIVAYNPNSSGKGRIPAVVTDFLSDDVRMGHTKKGSFIITVAARLDVESAKAVPSRTVSSAVAEAEVKPSFTRQVMTTLARSLSATKSRINHEEGLDAAVGNGLRLPLVQALEDVAGAEGLRALDMSFEWAAAEPLAEQLASRIVLGRDELEALPALRESLVRTHAPEIETIVGPVVELKRTDGPADSPETGEIVLRADVAGRLVKVTVPLSGTDYDWAIKAHQAKLPFSVTGQLGRKSNSWRLLDSISVDRTFLEHHFDNERAERSAGA